MKNEKTNNNNGFACPSCGESYRKQDFDVCPHCGTGSSITPKIWRPTKRMKKEYAKKINASSN